MKRLHPTSRTALAVLGLVALVPSAGGAWTPGTRLAMAEYARRAAPPDLARQLERHKAAYREAAAEPIYEGASWEEIEGSVRARTARAIAMIEGHRPFVELAGELGRLGREVAELSDPLRASDEDPYEDRFAPDWGRYVDSARPRFVVVFQGDGRDVGDDQALAELIRATGERARGLYPIVGREYRRIPEADGRQHFDDRSAAYGAAAVAFSHGVSDLVGVLRYIWIRAGGADERDFLPFEAGQVLLLPPDEP